MIKNIKKYSDKVNKTLEEMMGIVGIIIITLFLLWFGYKLLGWSYDKAKYVFGAHNWMGFYYYGGDIYNPEHSPRFKTRDAAINWVENKRNSRPQDAQISLDNLYEIGRDCEISKYVMELYICKETFDGGDLRQ